jgi:hypothetical protein
MEKITKTLKKVALKLYGFIPQALPTLGLTEFDHYCEMIFEIYDLPDLPSYRQAIATMIMNLGPTKHMEAPFYFAKSVKKAMANQIAYEKIQQLRKAEKEYLEKTLAEETQITAS